MKGPKYGIESGDTEMTKGTIVAVIIAALIFVGFLVYLAVKS